MDISYLGHSSFRIRFKNTFVVTDPYDSAKVGLKMPKVTANIVTISHDHFDHNHLANVKDYKKVVAGPGEYEIMDVSILGYPSFHDGKKGKDRGKNTIYVFETEGLRVCHLGDLGHTLKDKVVDKIGDIDILMIPVGGEYTIGPSEALEIVRAIEPNIIIPMHYFQKGMKKDAFGKLKTADEFMKASNLSVEKTNKLVVKISDVEEGQKIVLLEKK